MKKKAIGIVVLCMLLGVSWVCAADSEVPTMRYSSMMGCSKVATKSGITKTVVGDSFCVVLEENPSTGFTWEYTQSPEGVVEFIDSRAFEGEDADPKMVGAPVMRAWKFEARKEGEVTLTYIYHRPWETDVEPLETVEYRIHVTP
jgi:predicted secreted protein